MVDDDSLKNHAEERRRFASRVAVAGVLMAALVAGLGARMGYLQIARHGYYSTQSRENRLQMQAVAPVRGLIYDRRGVVLAENKPAYRLAIVPEEVDDLNHTVSRLARILPISAVAKSDFYRRVGRRAPFQATNLRLNLSPAEVARFEVNQMRFPGVHIRAGLTRDYPLGKIGAHVIGYVGGITARDLAAVNRKRYRGSSHIGKAGVEKSHESQLHGYPGARLVETNAAGRVLDRLKRQAPAPGDDIRLTLNARLQKAAFRALGDKTGAVVALDPATGGVLAMVSTPSFDPSLFADGISPKRYRRLLSAPDDPLLNRAIQGQYPPGSTIKPVMALAGVASGDIDADQKVWCPPYIELPNSDHHFRGWKRSGQGWLNLHQAIQRSADVYFYKLGRKVGIDTMHRYAAAFGLGKKTGIDLPHERAGVMPSRAWKHATAGKPWYPGETLNTVIGQGATTATPLQLAQMTSVIANRGQGYKPHLLKSWRSSSGTVQRVAPMPLAPVAGAEPSDWQTVVSGMRAVVSTPYGTAYHYVGQNLTYPLAGKSGTAQVASLEQGEAAPDEATVARRLRPHALFVAFAPIEDPEIAVAVVVEHGGGGSSVAGPIARRVIDFYLDHRDRRARPVPTTWQAARGG